MPKRFALAALGLLLVTGTWAQEAQKPEVCPNAKGWKPTTDENLLDWLEENKSEELCNIDLSGAKLANVDLPQAKLKYADLSDADLSGAHLDHAELSGADLSSSHLDHAELYFASLSSSHLNRAELSGANLSGAHLDHAQLYSASLSSSYLNDADLSGANLSWADLDHADLDDAHLDHAVLEVADLSGAGLTNAHLNHADLGSADLSGASLLAAHLDHADLRNANLSGAGLAGANLSGASLLDANLSGANLLNAHLDHADLYRASVTGASLAHTYLTDAIYAPASAPPDPYVAGIQGLSTVTFPFGNETGLVQLRDLLQKAGLRDLEREATFAIGRGETKHSLYKWKQDPSGAVGGIFRYVAFDLTTAYGLWPSRALLLIAAFWLLLIPIYAWPIWQTKRPPTASNVCRIWPKDRVEVRDHQLTLDNPARIERLHRRGLAAIGWSAYFSLLSAFQIGYREFSVGSWLSRAQPRNFALESTGWVRTVSGIQSLLSVYLLAMWLLTYFGRPFQ